MLRFKKQNGEQFADAEIVTIADLFDKVRKTNKDGSNKNVITNSAEFGLISQKEFFDKDIAVEENTNKYTIISYGDFVYNPRKSSKAPYGPFNCYKQKDDGIVSPLYFCIKPKDNSLTEYLLHYFSSPAWYSYIYYNGNQGGARHDRVGMTDTLLFGIPVKLPEKDERNKLVEFLNTYDKSIDLQTKRVQILEKRREGILNSIFSNSLSFNQSEDWEYVLLSEVLKERGEKNDGSFEVYSVSVSKGLVNQIEHLGRSYAAENTSKYNVVKPGDVVYTKSPTGNFKWGIVKQSTIDKSVVVSPLYGVFIPENEDIGYIIDAYFSSSKRAHNYLITQIRKGAKNTINVSNDEFLDKEIYLPRSREEQRKLVQFIKQLNKDVDIAKEKLEIIKIRKQALLRELFV